MLLAAKSVEELVECVKRPQVRVDTLSFQTTSKARRMGEKVLHKLLIARLVVRHWSAELPAALKAARQEGVVWGDVTKSLVLESSANASSQVNCHLDGTSDPGGPGGAGPIAQGSVRRCRRQSSEERLCASVQAISKDTGALAEMALLAMRERKRKQRHEARTSMGSVRASYKIEQRALTAKATEQLEAAIRIQLMAKRWIKRMRVVQLEKHAPVAACLPPQPLPPPPPPRAAVAMVTPSTRSVMAADPLASDPLDAQRPSPLSIAELSVGPEGLSAGRVVVRRQFKGASTPGAIGVHLPTPSPWRQNPSPRVMGVYMAARNSAAFVKVQSEIALLKREMVAAAEREDFDTAKEFKAKILPLRIKRAAEVAAAQAAARAAAELASSVPVVAEVEEVAEAAKKVAAQETVLVEEAEAETEAEAEAEADEKAEEEAVAKAMTEPLTDSAKVPDRLRSELRALVPGTPTLTMRAFAARTLARATPANSARQWELDKLANEESTTDERSPPAADPKVEERTPLTPKSPAMLGVGGQYRRPSRWEQPRWNHQMAPPKTRSTTSTTTVTAAAAATSLPLVPPPNMLAAEGRPGTRLMAKRAKVGGLIPLQSLCGPP